MLNRVTTILDKLQDADRKLSDDLQAVRHDFVPKSEFYIHIERLEKRLESYMALHMETSKTLFAKLDVINDRLGEKISRTECLQMMSDRRGGGKADQ